MEKEKKKIPLKDYKEILNRWGQPVTPRWLEILVKREKDSGEKAPFNWVQETGNTYVLID
jgi:hypothetical protein